MIMPFFFYESFILNMVVQSLPFRIYVISRKSFVCEPFHEKTNNLGFRPGPTQTRAVQAKTTARGWKF